MRNQILVIDDDIFFLKLVEKFFEDAEIPCDVVMESSSVRALEYISKHHDNIDLVVTDYHMPELNGLEVTNKAKKLLGDTPIILLTANKDRKVALQAIKEGVFDFIEKPFDATEFHTVINRALGFSKLVKERVELMTRLKKGGKEILRLSKELQTTQKGAS